jgi:hypothetical protein
MFNEAIRAIFPERHSHGNYPRLSRPSGDLIYAWTESSSHQCLLEHSCYLPEKVWLSEATGGVRYLTLLRDPRVHLHRLLKRFVYAPIANGMSPYSVRDANRRLEDMRNCADHGPSLEVRKAVPDFYLTHVSSDIVGERKWDRSTTVDWLRANPFARNLQAQFMAGWPNAFTTDAEARQQAAEWLGEAAIASLATNFTWFGIVERWDDSMSLLAHTLCLTGAQEAELRRNHGKYEPPPPDYFEKQAQDVPTELRAGIRELNPADFVLYEAALRLFEARLAQMRSDRSKGVRCFPAS